MSTAHRLAAAPPASGTLVDLALVVATLGGSLAQLAHGGIAGPELAPGRVDLTSALIVACSAAPLLAWRRAPGAVFAVTAVAAVLLGGLGYPIVLPFGPTVALYLLAASRSEHQPWSARTTTGVVALFAAYLLATAVGGGFPAVELVHTGLAWALAWFAGERTRLHREHLAELNQRAARAQRDGERERQLAVAQERTRIARDLHDAAGHAISVIAMRAGAARMRHDPDRSHAALELIEDMARRTAAEIDQIVGTLRDPGHSNGAVDSPPGLASLDTLIERHQASGLDASVARRGTSRALPHTVDQAAYRILQEALTNAARHGDGPATVEVVFGDTALELTISNRASSTTGERTNGGHGMVGMHERATLVGGSLAVDRTDGAFSVHAHLPYGEQAS